MKISFLKTVFLLLVCVFFFGDFFLIKKNLLKWLSSLNTIVNSMIRNHFYKTRKKGVEPLTFGFGNQYSTN